jgi:hypothetical protein
LREIWYDSDMKNESSHSDGTIPQYFKPILWSYDIDKIDLESSKSTIIINTINYGNLQHWKWLMYHYGKDIIREVLGTVPVTSIRPRVQRLATLLFDIKTFNHAPRSTSRRG